MESHRQQTGEVVSGATLFGIIPNKDGYIPVDLVFLVPVNKLRPFVVSYTIIGVFVLGSVKLSFGGYENNKSIELNKRLVRFFEYMNT